MEVLHPRCAGLDVHRDSVVACVRLAEGRHVERQVETFATTTADLDPPRMERAWLIAASALRSVCSWCREPVN